MKLYLDLCCLNRPFDDQTQPRVRSETQAIIEILDAFERAEHDFYASAALWAESAQTPDADRRHKVEELLKRADVQIPFERETEDRAAAIIRLGFRTFDAYHIASAEVGGCDRLVTCDDRFLKAAKRNAAKITVAVVNPISLVAEDDF